MKKQHLLWSLVIWSFIILLSFGWNYYSVKSSNDELVLNKFRAFFEQLVVTRSWNADHGGVYVPVTKKTQPNQYLKDSLRDVVTTNGIRLTKVNPAFMTRQIAEINELKNDFQFHITSLKPIRPGNKPDSWETKSLEMFESGAKENIELITNGSVSRYRYMAPLVTEKNCLQCHAIQGYKIGDIRGGMSISFTAMPYSNHVNKQIFTLGVFHLILLLVGAIGLWMYYRMANKYLLIIENKNKELTKANSERDKFYSIIAHDLRSPLGDFLGLTKIMSEEIYGLSKEEIHKYSTALNDSAESLYKLLENLLSWSRLKRNVINFNPEKLNMKEIVDNSYSVLKIPIENKKQNVEINISEEQCVYADKEMLKTVIRNLLSNASKFTHKGGSIYVSAKTENGETLISVKDTGIGIPETMIDKLFSLGEKTSRRGTDNEASSGLGLLLCKEFIEKNNGSLWVESKEEMGTTFYFLLPNAKDA